MSQGGSGTEDWTVRRVLEWTIGHLKQHGSSSPRLDAEVLLAHARGCPRIQLYTHYDEPLPDEVRAKMRELVKRRAAHEPVAYLVGQREFFSLEFQVSPAVFIPRPETETLVIETMTRLKEIAHPRILEIGTGSGCVSVTLAVLLKTAQLTAIDLSPQALVVANSNASKHHVADRIKFLHGDLFAPLERGLEFDAIVSNPPYIPTGELPTLQEDVRLHEPHLALISGPEGLDVLKKLITDSPAWLAKNGSLLCEFSPEQAPALTQQFAQHGWQDVRLHQDLTRRPRIISALRPER